MSARKPTYWIVSIAALALVLAIGVTASASASRSPQATTPSLLWTKAEIAKKLPGRRITPVWNVPKKLTRPYTFGFVNWSVAYPFFNDWSKGMRAAAKMFGVKFYEADAGFNTGKFLSLYEQLQTNDLDVVGFGATGSDVIVQAATEDGVKVVTIDVKQKGAAGIGIDNKPAGRFAGDFLGAAAKAKLAGPWKGSKLLYVAFEGAGCGPCTDRVYAARAAVQKHVKISESSITTPATNTELARVVTDLITSHPGWKLLITSYADEPLAPAVSALAASGNLSNALVVTMGGDLTGRTLLRKYPRTVVGAVEFNPFAEGFNWVVASIAYVNNKHFRQYPVTTILTPANVNKFYPKDPKS